MTTIKKELSYFRLKLEAYLGDHFPERVNDNAFVTAWKSHIILTLLAKQDLLLLATTYLILVKSWRRGQFYFTPFRYSGFSLPLTYACSHRIILWYAPYG